MQGNQAVAAQVRSQRSTEGGRLPERRAKRALDDAIAMRSAIAAASAGFAIATGAVHRMESVGLDDDRSARTACNHSSPLS